MPSGQGQASVALAAIAHLYHPQKKLLGLSGEIRSRRPGDDHADFAMQSQPQSGDGNILIFKCAMSVRRPFLSIISQQALKFRADLARF